MIHLLPSRCCTPRGVLVGLPIAEARGIAVICIGCGVAATSEDCTLAVGIGNTTC